MLLLLLLVLCNPLLPVSLTEVGRVLDPAGCWTYKKTENTVLDLGLGDTFTPHTVLSLRASYTYKTHKESNSPFNGFTLADGEGDAVLKVFNKGLIEKGTGQQKVPTTVRYCCDKRGGLVKYEFEDTFYSESEQILYQLQITDTTLVLRVNNASVTIPRPGGGAPWRGEHLTQRNDAMVFRSVSVCPEGQIASSIYLEPAREVSKLGACFKQGGDECPELADDVKDPYGTRMNLTCLAWAVPPIAISWQLDGADLVSSPKHTFYTRRHISGASFKLTQKTSGRYTCTVYNKYNTSLTTISSVHVSGYQPLTSHILQSKLEDLSCQRRQSCDVITAGKVTEFIGRNVSLKCVVSGSEPVEISWWFDGTQLRQGEVYQVVETPFSVEVVFGVEEATLGWYTCTANYLFNPDIKVEDFLQLAGLTPLSTEILEPKYQVVPAGTTVQFTCVVYQWPRSNSQRVFWSYLSTGHQHKPLSTEMDIRLRDAHGRSYDKLTLEVANSSYVDSGSFRCGTEIASLYVTYPLEAPHVSYNRTGSGNVEFVCSAKAAPKPTLSLSVKVDERNRAQDIELELANTTWDGIILRETWVTVTPITDNFRLWFSCRASLDGHHLATSGHFYLTKPMKTTITFDPSNMNGSIFRPHSGSFQVSCSCVGSPPPASLTLTRDGEPVQTLLNPDLYNYRLALEVAVEEDQVAHGGRYQCLTHGGASDAASANSVSVIVFEEFEGMELEVEGGGLVREGGVVEVVQGGHVVVNCTTLSGTPHPKLALYHSEEVALPGDITVSNTTVLLNAGLQVTESVNLTCVATQDHSGLRVTDSRTLSIVMVPWRNVDPQRYRDHMVSFISYPEVVEDIEVSSEPTRAEDRQVFIVRVVWVSVIAGVSLLGFILLYLLAPCVLACCVRCWKKKAPQEEIEFISFSEEELLRTRSIDQANRRLELLSHLSEHPVSDPNLRITGRSASRSREGLETLRSRYRAQSGDQLEVARAQSGDRLAEVAGPSSHHERHISF